MNSQDEALYRLASVNHFSVSFLIGRMYACSGLLDKAKLWIEHAMSAAMSLIGCSNYAIDALQSLQEISNLEEFERQSVTFNSALDKLQRRGADIWTSSGFQGNVRLMVLKR